MTAQSLDSAADRAYDSAHPYRHLQDPKMQLLVAVINHAELIDDVMAGFIELGITGATVLESKGMGRVISQELPIFAGLTALSAKSRVANRTIFCIAAESKVAAAIAMILLGIVAVLIALVARKTNISRVFRG